MEVKIKELRDQFAGIITRLNSGSLNGRGRVTCLDALVECSREMRSQRILNNRHSRIFERDDLVQCLRPIFVHRSKYLRAAVLRVARHLCLSDSPHFARYLWKYHCHYFVSKSLERDKRNEKEREQALIFVASLINPEWHGSIAISEPSRILSHSLIPLILVQSLVAISESVDENLVLRRCCIELLRDLLIKSPKLVAEANGIRTLLSVGILDPEINYLSSDKERPPSSSSSQSSSSSSSSSAAASATAASDAAKSKAFSGISEKFAARFPPPPPGFLGDSIAIALAVVFDTPRDRKYIRPFLDLSPLLVPFTEGNPIVEKTEKPAGNEKTVPDKAATERFKKEMVIKWELARRAFNILMKTWVGLIWLANPDWRNLESLVETLKMPGDIEKKRLLFDLFVGVLRSLSPPKMTMRFPILSREEDDDFWIEPSNSSSRKIMTASEDKLDDEDRIGSFAVFKTRNLSFNEKSSVSVFFLPTLRDGMNLTKNYLGAVVAAFEASGLIQTLISLAQTFNEGSGDSLEISLRASELLHSLLGIHDILFLGTERNQVLHDGFDRILSPYFDLKSRHVVGNLSIISWMYQENMRETFLLSGRKIPIKLEDVKIQVDTNMDSVQVLSLVQKSNVLLTKDVSKWDWDHSIRTLLWGPLKNPAKLLEILTKTKFVKRLVSFLKPKKKLFSEIPYKEEFIKYSQYGCQLLENLLQPGVGEDGGPFLARSGFLDQIAEILRVELKTEPDSSKDRVLKPEKIAYTMVREYFTLIGRISSSPVGIKLLEDFGVMDALFELMNSKYHRDDLSQLIIKNMDYQNKEVNKVTRQILQKAMVLGSKKIRYFATLRLRSLFRSSKSSSDFSRWGIELLVTQLADEWSEIVKSSIRLLEEACVQDPENLDALIRARPPLPSLENSIGKNLLFRIASRKAGLVFLRNWASITTNENWIEKELKFWRHIANTEYVRTVENALIQSNLSFSEFTEGSAAEYGIFGLFPMSVVQQSKSRTDGLVNSLIGRNSTPLSSHKSPDSMDGSDSSSNSSLPKKGVSLAISIVSEDGVCLPPHFYGELAKTPEGCDILRASGILAELEGAIRSLVQVGDCDNISKRAAVWAIGHIGSSNTGFELIIQESGLLPLLIQFVEQSPTLSFRGMCFFVLGLMTLSSTARAELEYLGWETRFDSKTNVAIAVPRKENISRLFQVQDYEYVGCSAGAHDEYTCDDDQVPLHFEDDRLNKILENVAQLANPVLQDTASKTLKKLRLSNMDDFCSPELVFAVFHLLETYKLKLQARRFIHELFDGTVFKEEDFRFLDQHYTNPNLDLSAATAVRESDDFGSSASSLLVPTISSSSSTPEGQQQSEYLVVSQLFGSPQSI